VMLADERVEENLHPAEEGEGRGGHRSPTWSNEYAAP
jgi:hypothetical protein